MGNVWTKSCAFKASLLKLTTHAHLANHFVADALPWLVSVWHVLIQVSELLMPLTAASALLVNHYSQMFNKASVDALQALLFLLQETHA